MKYLLATIIVIWGTDVMGKDAPSITVRPEVSLITGWEAESEGDNGTTGMVLDKLRATVDWRGFDMARVKASVELPNLWETDNNRGAMRDLYMQVAFARWFRIRMGQFKRPFGRLELISRDKLTVLDRGLTNDYVSEFLLFGDRDVGVMVSGRLHPGIKLDYAVGVFNGMDIGRREGVQTRGRDLVVRLDGRRRKWLRIGTSLSLKTLRRDDLQRFIPDATTVKGARVPGWVNSDDLEETRRAFAEHHAWMVGAHWMLGMDVEVRKKRFRAIVDAKLGENWWFEAFPYVWGVMGLFSHRFRLDKQKRFQLEPLIITEVFNVLTAQREWMLRMWRFVGGVNLHMGPYVRLMIHAEFDRAQGDESDVTSAPYKGRWPNEWPGSFLDSNRLLVMVGVSL